FDPEKIARYHTRKIEALLHNKGIVRNRKKLEATVQNAKSYLALRDSGEPFDQFLWKFTDGKTVQNRWKRHEDIPTETPDSRAMSKSLKSRGFSYCGPTICYAFMQAVGMVNDHVVTCFRHKDLRELKS
ncbi:MAG: DNA-3-methyladenine glycosylase I, partial [Dehalococcoidia bacterium]|nr:DNA-3-methyladenine glycosylase I [Dehalococcoidia bacterium]